MLCNCHKMYQRICFIYSHIDCFSDNNFLYLMNNWDRELVQFKLHLEVECTKFKTCHIEWSPEVGFWLSWRWLLAWVKVFVMEQGPADPCNLIRDCFHAHLCNPRYISHSHVMIPIKVTHRKFSELAKDAPALCCQHLLDLQKAADDWRDSVCSGIILEILTWEQEQKKWWRINNITRPPQGGNHSRYACNPALSLKHMTQRMKLLGTLPTTYPNASVLLILHHAIVGNYLMTLVSREIRNALSRSLKALMTTLQIPTFGRRKFCRRHIIHSLICLALRLQLLSQRKISKILGDGLMKGHHLFLAGSLSHITRLLVKI
jgi:hypothetical protein